MLKTLAFSLVLAMGLSSPTFAQTANSQPTGDGRVDAAAEAPAQPDPSDTTLDEADLMAATTQEDRARLLLRCAGPPPRPIASQGGAKEPMSEPAVAENAPAPGKHGG